MRKYHMSLLVVLVLPHLASCAFNQESLENSLFYSSMGEDDYVNHPIPEYVPEWKKDALVEYGSFISKGGWTTNQLIGAFIQAVTNRQQMTQKSTRDETIEERALIALSEINHPLALNFILQFCTNNAGERMVYAISGVYRCSDYGEEVFSYLRRACLMTNQYAHCVGEVALGLENCIGGLPDAQKPAATNRVAKYHYFTLCHTIMDMGLVDGQLSRLIPPYSNSVQRLCAMRHIANTTTNSWVKRWTSEEAERLEALPTNALNNVQWLEE